MTEHADGAARPAINIEGALVALGPLRRDLIGAYHRWNNDFGITRTLARSRPTTLEEETAAYDAVVADPTFCCFTVYERTTWRPIGTTYLSHIDHRNRCAEFGLSLREAGCHGKGYGTEATRLVLGYAFTVLGLNNVELTCRADNLAGLRVYEKAGFTEIGRRRECRWMGGRLWDNVHMDCLQAPRARPTLSRVVALDEPSGKPAHRIFPDVGLLRPIDPRNAG